MNKKKLKSIFDKYATPEEKLALELKESKKVVKKLDTEVKKIPKEVIKEVQKDVTGEEIVKKINELELTEPKKIDFTHIKGFPWDNVRRMGGGESNFTGYGAYDLNLKAITLGQITANQNNYITGLGAWFRISSDAARSITGFDGGTDGRSFLITNVGSFAITLEHQDAGSNAGNRILSESGADLILAANDTAWVIYDVVTERWRAILHSLGGGSSVSFGTDNQIPFMNAGGTDFDYSANLTFDGTTLAVTGDVSVSNDILIASAGVINFAAGDVTITHSANALDIDGGIVDFGSGPTVAGAAIYYVGGTDVSVADGGTGASTLTGLLQGNGTSAFTAITNSSTVGQVLRVTGASTYAWGALDLADGDAITGTLGVASGGTGITSFAAGIATWLGSGTAADLRSAVSGTTGSGNLVFATAPSLVTSLSLDSGFVIDWATSDLTLTHSANTLTLAGGNLALGTNSLTMTGSIGATGARVTKGWFTDLEVTNAIAGSITGNAATLTVADETTDATSFIGFYTAASGTLAGKTNTNMTFDASTGIATFASTVLTTTDINGGTIDGVTIGGTSAGAGTFTTLAGTTITASTGFALGDGDYVGVTGNEILTFATAGTITASGADFLIADGNGLLIGHTAQLAVGGITAESEQFGTAADDATMALGMFNATAGTQAEFMFYRSKNAAIGSATVVASGDGLGKITWYGAQQTGTFATQNPAAQILAEVDGTVTSGAGADMPGRIVFKTTPNASGTLTTALTIDSTQQVVAAVGFMPDANDGAYLGQAGTAFSDLFLAEGGVINWDSGDATITQTGNILAVAGADFRIATADVGTNADSVPTLSSTSTFTNKTLTSPTLTTPSAFTTGGTITLAENTSIALDPAGSADGKYTGITVTGTAGATLAFGDLIYLDPTDSRWELCDANAASAADGDSRGIIGICVLAAAADGNATTILLTGIVRADAAFPAMTINAPMYVSETAGDITGTQPTTTDAVIRVVGHAITADELFFKPDNIYFTHT